MAEQIHWRAMEPSQVACFLELSVEELETLPGGTKPRTPHLQSPGGERCGMRKC